MKHYRIKNSEDKLVAGEFAEETHAANWAKQHIVGFWTIVETDRYGNDLNDMVGFMVPVYIKTCGEFHEGVYCIDCVREMASSADYELLHRGGIYPFKQTCHQCGECIVTGEYKENPELFPKYTNGWQLKPVKARTFMQARLKLG